MIVEERLTTYIDSLNWQIPACLKEVEKEALADGVPIIRRSMQSLLGFLLRTRKPDAVLEIGTAVGFSAMLMRENLKPDAVLDTIEKERRYECSLEDFLSVAREIPLKDQETVNTEEKNVQEDNSEDSKSKLGDSDCAPWIED